MIVFIEDGGLPPPFTFIPPSSDWGVINPYVHELAGLDTLASGVSMVAVNPYVHELSALPVVAYWVLVNYV